MGCSFTLHLVCLGQDFIARKQFQVPPFIASVLVASFIIAHYYRIHERVALSNGVLRGRTRSAPRPPAGTARLRRAAPAARGCGRAALLYVHTHHCVLLRGTMIFFAKLNRIINFMRPTLRFGTCFFAHCVRSAVLVNSRGIAVVFICAARQPPRPLRTGLLSFLLSFLQLLTGPRIPFFLPSAW